MIHVLPSIIDGLLIGFVYGVAAMGLTLIWGVMRVINLGHGATMALGMFCTYFLFSDLSLNSYLGLVAVVVLSLLFGFLIYGVALQRVIQSGYLSTLLATFAVNMIIIQWQKDKQGKPEKVAVFPAAAATGQAIICPAR